MTLSSKEYAEVILWSKLKNRQMYGERILRQYGIEQYSLKIVRD